MAAKGEGVEGQQQGQPAATSREGTSVIRTALANWHGLLQQDPVTRTVLLGASAPHERPPISDSVQAAATYLAQSLEDAGLHDALIDDVLSIVTTITGLCGVTLTVESSGSELYPDGQGPSVGAGPGPGSGSASHDNHYNNGGGASSGSSSNNSNLAKMKLFKDGTGLPVHKTSIGRRASASYCVYESMGGWETLSAAVESLYNRMQDDHRCASLFAGANEKQLKALTLEFLTCALGGKDRFASSIMLQNQRDQLRRHGFGAGQFDVMLQHLKAVLEELSVQVEVARSAVALLRCNRCLFERSPSEEDAGGSDA